MGIWGGVLFLIFNAFILVIIRWCIENDNSMAAGSGAGLFAMRKSPKKPRRTKDLERSRMKLAYCRQGQYRESVSQQPSTSDDA
jgi:hypothetical protein